MSKALHLTGVPSRSNNELILEFQKSDVSPEKQISNKVFVDFISQAKGYFRETYIS